MAIHLLKHLENSIHALVKDGRFASVDEAMNEAARLLLNQQSVGNKPMTEQEFDQYLLDMGLMTQLPDSDADFDDPGDQLIDIKGEALSETVLRERR